MDATTMQSIHSLVKKLAKDYPQFHFELSDEFLWSPRKRTVFIDPSAQHAREFSLHELSHALLDHHGYLFGVNLIKIERDAWAYAEKQLAPLYGIHMSEELVQDNLDTYREWLYARSLCPECEATGLETRDQAFRCLSCGHEWRVNDARTCALRRYSTQTK